MNEVIVEDKVEVIPSTMEKFFGCSGKLVKPSPETVKNIVERIALGNLMTTAQLKEDIALTFSVQTACPVAIMKSLILLSKEDDSVSFWRIIKPKGELINKFLGGVDGHANKLQHEGFIVDFDKKIPVVSDFKSKLVTT